MMTGGGFALVACVFACAVTAGLLGAVWPRPVVRRATLARLNPGVSAGSAGRIPAAIRGLLPTSFGALRDVVRQRRRTPDRPPDAATLAALLDRVARHCASGESLAQSLRSAAGRTPGHGYLGPTVSGLERGRTVRDSLASLDIQHPDAALAVHALQLCAEQGGNVSESLDRAASTLRERHTIRLERVAHGAQARLSATVLTVLPIAFSGWTLATTTSVRRFATTLPGFCCVALGLACNLAGWRLMSRTIRHTP